MSRFSLEKIRRAGVFWYIRHRVHRTRFERTADEDKRKHERGDLSLQLQNAEREGDVPQRHAATRRSDCARDLSQPRRNLHRLREEDEDRRKGLRQGLRRAEDGGEDRENRSAGGREGRHPARGTLRREQKAGHHPQRRRLRDTRARASVFRARREEQSHLQSEHFAERSLDRLQHPNPAALRRIVEPQHRRRRLPRHLQTNPREGNAEAWRMSW